MPTDNLPRGFENGETCHVATKNIGGGVHVSKVLTVDDSGVAIDSTNPLPVRGASDVIAVTLSLDTSAYADGDLMADSQVITNAARVVGGRVILQTVTVLDEDDQGQTFDLIFLNGATSLGAENSAPSITDANARNILAVGSPSNELRVNAGDYIDLGGCKVATKTGLGVVLEAATDSRDIYIATVIRGSATYTAAGVRLQLGFLQD